MDFLRIASRIAAEPVYKSYGEPKVPHKMMKDNAIKSAEAAEDAARAAVKAAGQDGPKLKEAVLLITEAAKAWKYAGNRAKAKEMQGLGYEKDQELKKLTGEMFGIPSADKPWQSIGV